MVDVSIRARFEFERAAPRPFWRVLHDSELPTGVRPAAECPEVFFGNREETPFGADWQLLSYALNPGMTGAKWRALYAFDKAFTNGTGFDNPNTGPRADFVNGRDLGAQVPYWKSFIFCGGASLRGEVDGVDLVIEKMDGYGPAPTLAWLLAHPWLYFVATTVRENGTIGNFPHMGGLPVYIPLVGSGEARYPLSKLCKVNSIADPYYRRTA